MNKRSFLIAALPLLFLMLATTVRGQEDFIAVQERAIAQAIGNNHIGLEFVRISRDGTEDFRVAINEEEAFPLASSFKGFALFCYLRHTPRDSWQIEEGSLAYSMAVYSNNVRTGVLLADMARVNGASNPIVFFNDCLKNDLGLKFGLYSWNWPDTPTVGYTDERFAHEEVVLDGDRVSVNNVTTAHDILTGFLFLANAENNPLWQSDPDFRAAIRATRRLLSIPATGYPSPIEPLLLKTYYYGKDGTLRSEDLPALGGRVLNDAVVIPVMDGGSYVISLMSARESETTVWPVFRAVVDTVTWYEQINNPGAVLFDDAPSAPVVMGQYNYGFVRGINTSLFLIPNQDAPLFDNPIRPGSVYGNRYVYRGALLRFLPVNDQWGLLVIDEPVDDVYNFSSVYVRIEDLRIIDLSTLSPIGFVSGQTNVAKLVIVDTGNRVLTLLEGVTVVLRTPIIINSELTPTGYFVIHNRVLSRNMPHWPGVPFANYLYAPNDPKIHTTGYAIHGMPAQLWSQTVREGVPETRLTGGCINLPDWQIPIGGVMMRVDEFVFRWMGGQTNAATETYIRPGASEVPVRVVIRDNVWDIPSQGYTLPQWYYENGVSWTRLIEVSTATPLMAPDSFFAPEDSTRIMG